MRQVSTSLKAYLETNNVFAYADLVTVELPNGTTLRWSLADTDVTIGLNTFLATGPTVKRGKVQWSSTLKVDEMDLTLGHAGNVLVGSMSLSLAAEQGVFDEAVVTVERIYMPTWGDTSLGTMLVFKGKVSEVEPTSSALRLKVTSDLWRLNQRASGFKVQESCNYSLYDSGCGVAKASYTSNCTVAAGSTTTVIYPSIALPVFISAGSWIEFTGGANQGLRAVIKERLTSPDRLVLARPLAVTPGVGDSIAVVRGCDKTRSTCRTVFGNLARFRGYPEVPLSTISYILPYTGTNGYQAAAYVGFMRILESQRPTADALGYGRKIPVVYGTQKVRGFYQFASYLSNVGGTAVPPGSWLDKVWRSHVEIGFCEGGAGVAPLNFWFNGSKQTTADFFAVLNQNGGTAWADGSPTQTPWSFRDQWATSNPDWMMAYRGTAVLRSLGFPKPNGQFPEVDCEVQGFCRTTGADAHPADVLIDILTHPVHGLGRFGFTAASVDVDHGSDGLAASSYRTYCTAMGFTVSGLLDGTKGVKDVIANLLASTNAWGIYSDGKLKIVPLGDTPVTGNGATYTPPGSAIAVNADDFVVRSSGDDPVRVERRSTADCFNVCPVSFVDRQAEYNESIRENGDGAAADGTGQRRAEVFASDWISTTAHAMALSYILAQRSGANEARNTYTFSLSGYKYGLLEPGDFLTLSESMFGLTNRAVRIERIEENGDDVYTIRAIGWPIGITTAITVNAQTSDGLHGVGGGGDVAAPQYVSDVALGTATQAVNDAATAQTTANSAQTAANTAQSAADAAAVSATNAQASADAAAASAANAQAVADSAQALAQTVQADVQTRVKVDWTNATNIPGAQLALGTVPTGALADGSVTGVKVAAGAIDSTKLGDGAITLSKFGSGLRPIQSVGSLPALPDALYPQGATVFLTTDNKLYRSTGSAWTTAVLTSDLSGTITTTQITDGAINTAKLAAGSVTTTELAAGSVTTLKLAASAVTANEIAAGAITTAKLAAGAVTTTELAANAVVAGKVAADAIGTTQLVANAVTAGKLAVGAVTADSIAANAVTAGKILAGAVGTEALAALAVTTAKLAAGAVTANEISAGAVTADKIAAGSITAEKLAAQSIVVSSLYASYGSNLWPNGYSEFAPPANAPQAVLDSAEFKHRTSGDAAAGTYKREITGEAYTNVQLDHVIGVCEGDMIEFRGHIKVPVGGFGSGGRGRLYIRFNDAGSSWAGSSQVGSTLYTAVSVKAVVPAGATTATLRLAVEPGSVATTVYFDNIVARFQALMPTGTIAAWAYGTATTPPGWLVCDGAAVSRTAYADLFGLINILYGSGDGSTTFNVPDLRGRVPIGASTLHSLASTGGAETHTLTTAEIPSHQHTLGYGGNDNTAVVQGTQRHANFFNDAYNFGVPKNTNATGSGGAHNNMQPFLTINYIIKT